MIENYSDSVAFVIDTEQYAGNFEREMCAYLTGRIGECEVGEEFVDPVIKEKFNNVIDMPDEHGCYRPTTCFPLKGDGANNAVAIFFDEDEPPTEEQIALMKERAQNFQEAYRTTGPMAEFNKDKVINITGFRMIEFSTTSKEIEV
jgi:hypothetical protein